MLTFAQQKPKKTVTDEPNMSMEEVTNYLKKIGEWESVAKMDRETIMKYAEFLKKKGATK
jgi:hypothetical protein